MNVAIWTVVGIGWYVIARVVYGFLRLGFRRLHDPDGMGRRRLSELALSCCSAVMLGAFWTIFAVVLTT